MGIFKMISKLGILSAFFGSHLPARSIQRTTGKKLVSSGAKKRRAKRKAKRKLIRKNRK